MLQEYLKAVPALTISDNSTILAQQLADLKQSNDQESHMVSTSLKEKDMQIASLGHKVDEFESKLSSHAIQIHLQHEVAQKKSPVLCRKVI